VPEERKQVGSPDHVEYDSETDLIFDEYLKTAEERDEFAIPKMRVTQPSQVTREMRERLLDTIKQAHAERLFRDQASQCRTYGEFFRAIKQARGLNWKVLAERLNTTVEQIGRIERNELHPTGLTVETHRQLIDLYTISAEYYIDVLRNLLVVEAENAVASARVQFARKDEKVANDNDKYIEQLCASARDAEREELERFRALIRNLESELTEAEGEFRWVR
jgi:transcriptional regulator with XRE-family HTH domain